MIYDSDLAYIHHVGYGSFSGRAATGLLERLLQAGISSGRVVDVGCGGGHWLRRLVDAGYDAVGIEPSAGLVSQARALVPEAEIFEASAYERVLPSCRAITSLGEVLCYFVESSPPPMSDFLRKAADALEPGGLLVFDVIVTGEPSLDAKTWRAGDDWAVLVEVKEHRDQGLLEREIITFRQVEGHYRRGTETHRQAVWSAEEIESWLGEAGFTGILRIDAYGDQPMLPRRQAFCATR
ncbi:MAG: class I SAM-dependent methyltransferase [Planctomycetota bacterium]